MTMGNMAKKYFLDEGLNCAVSVLLAANEYYSLGLSRDDAQLITAFGGGLGCGNLCGALAGAQAALGKILLEEGSLGTPEFREACAGFLAKFKEEFSCEMCEKVKELHADADTRCYPVVSKTCDMLCEYVAELKK